MTPNNPESAVTVEQCIEAMRLYSESGNSARERIVFLTPALQAAILAHLRSLVAPHGVISDGFGNSWRKCAAGCHLEIVRPGKVQCDPTHCHAYREPT